MAVSVGQLALVQAGLRYRMSRNVALQLELGKLRSLSGALDSEIVNFNLVYSFSRPELCLAEPR
jgi:hypothetical protein